MKKNGFTLAEVLMTMTIIGVIASMTLPTLTLNTRTAQIGPKLATAVASFEQANQALLAAEEVDSLTDLEILGEANTYSRDLIRFLKGTIPFECDKGKCLINLNSDTNYLIYHCNGSFTEETENNNEPHRQRLACEEEEGVTIEINNRSYPFSLWNDGSLRPMGSTGWDGTSESVSGRTQHWSHENNCPNGQTPTNASYCAGSIFENNLRVRYRM